MSRRQTSPNKLTHVVFNQTITLRTTQKLITWTKPYWAIQN